MNDGDLAGESGQEQALFQGAVAAANHHDFPVLEEETIAGGAIADAAAGQLRLARNLQLARGCAHGQDDGFGLVFLLELSAQGEGMLRQVQLQHVIILDSRAELLGLFLESFSQICAAQTLGEAGIILDFVGQGHLAADVVPGEEDRIQLGAGSVEPRGKTGGTAADDNYFFDFVFIWLVGRNNEHRHINSPFFVRCMGI